MWWCHSGWEFCLTKEASNGWRISDRGTVMERSSDKWVSHLWASKIFSVQLLLLCCLQPAAWALLSLFLVHVPWPVFSSITVISCLIVISNSNLCAKKKQDGWPKFLKVWFFYLWTSYGFLPLRKRTLPNVPWVFCEFFFIDWKLLLSTTVWSSFSVREIPRKSAMFFTPRIRFWKDECDLGLYHN